MSDPEYRFQAGLSGWKSGPERDQELYGNGRPQPKAASSTTRGPAALWRPAHPGGEHAVKDTGGG